MMQTQKPSSTEANVDCRDVALQLLKMALGGRHMPTPGHASNTHLAVETAMPKTAEHDRSSLHPFVAHWAPPATPVSEIVHLLENQAASLQQRVLQQAQSNLQATHCLTTLCTGCITTARQLPVDSSEQVHQWQLLAQFLDMLDAYVSQLKSLTASKVPEVMPKHTQKRVRTKLQGTVHTLSFSLDDADERGLGVGDADAMQPELLALACVTGDADRQEKCNWAHIKSICNMACRRVLCLMTLSKGCLCHLDLPPQLAYNPAKGQVQLTKATFDMSCMIMQCIALQVICSSAC